MLASGKLMIEIIRPCYRLRHAPTSRYKAELRIRSVSMCSTALMPLSVCPIRSQSRCGISSIDSRWESRWTIGRNSRQFPLSLHQRYQKTGWQIWDSVCISIEILASSQLGWAALEGTEVRAVTCIRDQWRRIQSLIQEIFDEFSPKLSYADDLIDTFLTDSKGCVNDYKWSVVRPVCS